MKLPTLEQLEHLVEELWPWIIPLTFVGVMAYDIFWEVLTRHGSW